jgi:tryptophanyl-tRNA synthetase
MTKQSSFSIEKHRKDAQTQIIKNVAKVIKTWLALGVPTKKERNTIYSQNMLGCELGTA